MLTFTVVLGATVAEHAAGSAVPRPVGVEAILRAVLLRPPPPP